MRLDRRVGLVVRLDRHHPLAGPQTGSLDLERPLKHSLNQKVVAAVDYQSSSVDYLVAADLVGFAAGFVVVDLTVVVEVGLVGLVDPVAAVVLVVVG